jgi:hypothetical protein
MTDVTFRISGAISPELTPEQVNDTGVQVMHQGIGFDRVPISNAPPDEFDDVLNEDTVATGSFMQWMGVWSAGKFYAKGSYVRTGTFTAVANKLTLDNPQPIPSEPASYILPDPWVLGSPAANASVVEMAVTITLTSQGWSKGVRIWGVAVSDDISYEAVVSVTEPGEDTVATRITDPAVIAGEWSTIALPNEPHPVGTVIELFLIVLNSGASTNISGGWGYQGTSPIGQAPIAQNWTVNNGQTDFRINKFDLDGTDRSTELEGVLPGSIITVVQTDNVALSLGYTITNVFDGGTFMTYAVVLGSESGGGPKAGTVTTIDIDVPIPLDTDYQEETGYFPAGLPSWGTVETALAYDGVDQAAAVTTMYGIDLEFEPAEVSLDWDIVTTAG